MKTRAIFRILVVTALFCLGASAAQALTLHDESIDGDLGDGNPPNADLFVISSNGTFDIVGTGTDVVDDGDSFNFTVTGGTFDFVLSGPAAEFKWLDLSHDCRGCAGGSFNAGTGDLSVLGLAAGDYSTHMFFGGAVPSGPWTATITVSGIAAPEPGSFALAATGVLALAVHRHRRRR